MHVLDGLKSEVAASEAHKSSHWLRHAAARDGFGTVRRASWVANAAHALAQRVLLGGDVFAMHEYRNTKDWCKRVGRALDMDVLRQALTINRLRPQLETAKRVAVIGDGRGNFVGAFHYSMPPRAGGKLISVNLPEVLIEDYPTNIQTMPPGMVALATDRQTLDAQLVDVNTQMILVPANRADILRDAGIDLFVNIASFQEMAPTEIARYFEIIASNHAYLYACNRSEKILYGGEVVRFDDYPWDNAEVLFSEPSPWTNRFYSMRPPFFGTYPEVRHALVKFN